MSKITSSIIIGFLLALAFLVRIANVHYGLPLWLINDEPSTILGALKMLELKTLIPAFHVEEFRSVLYYPPYLSYIYLLPFAALIGIKYIALQATPAIFANILASDLSAFFIIARLISIGMALMSAFLVYKITLALFRQKIAALFALFFVSTSFLHISLSANARHWMPVSFIFTLGFYFLSHPIMTFQKRYVYFGITAALGMGISPIAGILFALAPLWFFLYEHKRFEDMKVLFKHKKIYAYAFLMAFLIALPTFLYPSSNGFLVDVTSHTKKTFASFIISPLNLLKPLFISEFIFAGAALIGFALLFRHTKRLTLLIVLYIWLYSAVFYLIFRHENRFILPILPFIAIIAGYGMWGVWTKRTSFKVVIIIVLLIPLASTVRLAQLGLRNDSKILALEWVERNVPPGSKIIISGAQMRLGGTRASIEEQRAIDSSSLRRIDLAEEVLSGTQKMSTYYSLNLYSIRNQSFLDNFERYALSHNFTYLVKQFVTNDENTPAGKLAKNYGGLLASFGNEKTPYSLIDNEFKRNPLGLFRVRELGPRVEIFKIQP